MLEEVWACLGMHIHAHCHTWSHQVHVDLHVALVGACRSAWKFLHLTCAAHAPGMHTTCTQLAHSLHRVMCHALYMPYKVKSYIIVCTQNFKIQLFWLPQHEIYIIKIVILYTLFVFTQFLFIEQLQFHFNSQQIK